MIQTLKSSLLGGSDRHSRSLTKTSLVLSLHKLTSAWQKNRLTILGLGLRRMNFKRGAEFLLDNWYNTCNYE